jgi:hypothetical protein
MRGGRAVFKYIQVTHSPDYLRRWLRKVCRRGVKQTSCTGYSPPAYLGRGWIKGCKAIFEDKLPTVLTIYAYGFLRLSEGE